MFIELPRPIFEQLKPKLNMLLVTYNISDCTIEGDEVEMVHLNITGDLRPDQIERINFELDEIYEQQKMVPREKRDLDGNGIADIYEEGPSEIREVRRRKWDETGHTLKQEAKGWFTGENTEEEVTYERR